MAIGSCGRPMRGSRGKLRQMVMQTLHACAQADELDYAIRKKDLPAAQAALAATRSALDGAIAAV